jgi:hypothetical protein
MFAGLFANVWAKIAAVGAIVLAVLAAFAKAVSLGRTAEREKAERAQLENVAKREAVDRAVAARSAAINRARLLDKYTRG